MPKNIVLCCDGTANDFDGDRTNVVKLYQMLVHDKDQVTYYHPGLGTMEPIGALTAFSRWWTRQLGYAFGYGLKNDIRDAYVFLMNHYEKDDRVFLFGFSRGAYTARAVASLLYLVGVTRLGNEPLVPYAIRMIANTNPPKDADGIGGIGRMKKLSAQFKQTFASLECAPHFVGVWDTVNSVGWIGNPLRLPHTADNPSIKTGRHAIAIDERRAYFGENLWYPDDPAQDIVQVWFPGSHGDVGGGYPERDCHLSKVALKWMLREAQHKGLRTDPVREARVMGEDKKSPYVSADETPRVLHDELVRRPIWWLGQITPKKHGRVRVVDGKKTWTQYWTLGLAGWRQIPKDPTPKIHESALERDEAYIRKLPETREIVKTLNRPSPP